MKFERYTEVRFNPAISNVDTNLVGAVINIDPSGSTQVEWWDENGNVEYKSWEKTADLIAND